jgi:hypothetical protein
MGFLEGKKVGKMLREYDIVEIMEKIGLFGLLKLSKSDSVTISICYGNC